MKNATMFKGIALSMGLAVMHPSLQAQSSEIDSSKQHLSTDIEDPGQNPIPMGKEERTVEAFSFYPNPVQDKLNINFGRDGSEKVVEIFDLVGNLALRQKIAGVENSLSLAHLRSGIYILRVSDRAYRFEKI